MIRVTGMQAVREIGRLQASLRRLAELPRRVATLAAPELTKLLQQEFTDGADPYGRSWKPLRPATLAKGRRPPPLTDTARTKRGTKATTPRANYAGIRLVTGSSYAYFHQVGFRVGRTRVPARRILPQSGIPGAWSAVLRKAAQQASAQAMATSGGR